MMSMKKEYSFLAPKWRELLSEEFQKPYMESIRQVLKSDISKEISFFPPKDKIFRAFTEVDYDRVKVVIIGQDPYHNVGQANGFAFAVNTDTAAPPSLLNIFKEVAKDIQTSQNLSTTLEGWSQQGVFLLNTVLTVRKHQALSHRGIGLESFTDKAIELLSLRKEPIVFLLWGSAAQKKSELIDSTRHYILNAPHPSPLSAHRGFLGCQHFSKTNKILESLGYSPIDWARA